MAVSAMPLQLPLVALRARTRYGSRPLLSFVGEPANWQRGGSMVPWQLNVFRRQQALVVPFGSFCLLFMICRPSLCRLGL